MKWYNNATFYHIYPIGLLGVEKENDYKEIKHTLNDLYPWIDHMKEMGFNALYIGPLFKSGSHGYDTTDYRLVDNRLGDNNDLKKLVDYCHKNDIKVILDAVFNHTGRDFFAFKDILEKRENSTYRYWYNINFNGNNSYNDGFSYENWGGYDLLVKLNVKNPEVYNYIFNDVVKYWVDEYDIDGLRLDTANVLDFEFLHKLREYTNNLKEDFYLMGEVMFGEYTGYVNESMLHAVTNFNLEKAIYSGLNDHNFFEIAHTENRLINLPHLYNFVDNHDIERISTKLKNKAHFLQAHIMLYTLPGTPAIYYGSEFGIEGHKDRFGPDDEIRPSLNINDYKDCLINNPYSQVVAKLAHFRKDNTILAYGEYRQIELKNEYYSYTRKLDNEEIFVCLINNETYHEFYFETNDTYHGLFSNKEYIPENNRIKVCLDKGGEVLYKKGINLNIEVKEIKQEVKEELKKDYTLVNKQYEDMSIEELQDAILSKMASNGPVNDQMIKTVRDNIWRDSLINWVKSFR